MFKPLKMAVFMAAMLALPLPAMAFVARPAEQSVVFAGGCFWGVQAVFQHVKGVESAVSGYSGGPADKANYGAVSTGTTGHAESVKVTYNPAQVSFDQLMKVFFSVAHNPTELNRQGPDHGTQYRSEIFFTTPEQEQAAHDYIAALDKSKAYGKPVVTKVEALRGFYPAEAYHQDYAALHPNDPYIFINDAPKVENLKKQFPDLYVEGKKD